MENATSIRLRAPILPPPDYTFDKDRLAALDGYGVLDTSAEPGFDDIVQLASQICDTPVALVSLVTAERQWFKARIGFEPCETDLDRSVCAHALVEGDLLVIPDLRLDPRTRDNPLVTEAPFIRFYAGAPLIVPGGETVGSLCVIDAEPRPQGLTDAQASGLRSLAGLVVSQLELRKTIRERDRALALKSVHDQLRQESEAQYRMLFEAIDDGFCVIEMKFEDGVAVDYRFIEINSAFAGQTGLTDVEGKWVRDLVPGHEQHWFDSYGEVALTGRPARFEHLAAKLGDRWYAVQAFRIGDADALRVAVLFSDITDRKARDELKPKAEETQTLLNHELSHRMKNMFSLVQAIANQTLRDVEERELIHAFKERIRALSRAHDVLLKQSWAAAELGAVVEAVVATLAADGAFDISGPDVLLNPGATPTVSLLLYELATNALKYGALSTRDGRVEVRWRVEGSGDSQTLTLDWTESGGPAVAQPSRAGFGSRLIRMGLAGSGGADLRYDATGLKARFSAPFAQVSGG
jgi:PAS domain S-box-containing protein